VNARFRRDRLFLCIVAAAVALAVKAGPAAANDGKIFEWGTPQVVASFDRIDFLQPVTLSFPAKRAELVIELQGRLPLVSEIDPPSASGSPMLSYQVDPHALRITPHTMINAWWRLTFGAVLEEVGPVATVIYEDDRFSWREASRTIHGLDIRVHWYKEVSGLADRALTEAVAGLERAESAFGVLQADAVEVYLYTEAPAFRDATGASRDFAGTVDIDTNTVFALVTGGNVGANTAATIRHEVTHVVFNGATGIPTTSPPRWLNEGAASYLMDLAGGSWFRGPILEAARSGALIPLDRLTFAFPSATAEIDLAYEEGASAVEYLIRAHGLPALAKLAAAFRSEMTPDEAFSSVLGVDVKGFQKEWLDGLRAAPLKNYGPERRGTSPTGSSSGWKGASGLALRLLLTAVATLIVEIHILRRLAGRWRVARPVGWRSWADDERRPAVWPATPPPSPPLPPEA
jgi:hypothetical protein